MSIKPIETHYAGCRFRSRLEARWAVFFDTLGIPWEYEPQGLELGTGARYLPDFRIGDGLLVEVKGSEEMLGADRLVAATENHVTSDRLLILGPIPRPDGPTPGHWMIRRIGADPYMVVCFFEADGRVHQHGVEYVFAPAAIGGITEGRPLKRVTPDPAVQAAYTAARSARFEHGASG